MSILKMIKNIKKPRPHSPPRPKKKVIKGPDGKIIDLSRKLRKKSKPTSTAKEKYIASKAVKPKAKAKTKAIRSPHK